MNKAELTEAVQGALGGGASLAAAERALDAVLESVKAGLRRDQEVQIVGFGTFEVAARTARRGFNPHTRRPMKIPAIRTVRFRPGTGLRNGV
jgi:nucleoid DNA-binding protein